MDEKLKQNAQSAEVESSEKQNIEVKDDSTFEGFDLDNGSEVPTVREEVNSKATTDVESKDSKSSEVAGAKKEEKPVKNNQSKAKKMIDTIIDLISVDLSEYGRLSDKKQIEGMCKSLFATIFEMCALDEYAIGPVVDGVPYRYEDYEVSPTLQNLLVAKKVVARDVTSARSVINHSQFKSRYAALTPGEFASTLKKVMVKLRVNAPMTVLTRPPVELLNESVLYAVTNEKVVDRNADHIIFLKYVFDEEANDAIAQWCNSIALKFMNQK